MPKWNAVLMVVLSAAVLGGLGWAVLGKSDPAAAREDDRRLLRKLADADPDLRREAAAEFRARGPRGRALLRQAAGSDDRRLAERARELLAELEPPLPPPAPPAVEPPILFEVVCSGPAGRATRSGPFMVRAVNKGTVPAVLVQEAAAWEVESDDRTWRLAVAFVEPGPVVVAPGQDVVLAGAQDPNLLEMTRRPEIRRLRFVYDASEGSRYRELVKPSERGVPLPPGRYASGVLELD